MVKIAKQNVAMPAGPLQQIRDFTKRHHRLCHIGLLASPFVVYVLLTLLYFGPSSFGMIHTSLFNPSPDVQLIVWNLNWWPFSFTHHINPFLTRYIWSPQGFNLAWATSVPTLGIIMAPITLLFGATASFNILAIIGPALSATACFYLVYYLTKHYFGSFIAGYLYGFSSYELGQYVSHTSLYLTFLIPLLVLLYVMRLKQRIGKVLFIVVTTVLLVLQFGISNEIFATFFVFATIGLVLFYLFSDLAQKKLILITSIEFYTAGLLSIIALTPYLYYLVIGYKNVPHVINSPIGFSTDVLNYFVPTPITKFGSGSFRTIAEHFSGNYSEDGGYLGLPLLLTVLYFTIKYWRKHYTKPLIGLLIVIMLLSLGPKLQLDGLHHHTILLPWTLALKLPLVKSALPDRFTMFASLAAAVIIGIWLSFKSSTVIAYIKYAVTLSIIVSIFPNTSLYSWRNITTPTVFQAASVDKYIKKNSNIIILPYGILGSSMYYQYESGMHFTQTGGYIGFTPPKFATQPIVTAFYSGVPEANFKSDLTVFCRTNKVSAIIYTPDTSKVLITALDQQGWKIRTLSGAAIVTVPSADTNRSGYHLYDKMKT
jgi:hypothetical protein